MQLSKLSRRLLLFGALLVTSCTPKPAGSLTINDVVATVGDIVPLTITFEPISVASSIVYSNYDTEVATISDDTLLALKAGTTTAKAVSGKLETTFSITVNDRAIPVDPVAKFNEYGEITDGLPGFLLTGDNLEHHIVENDNDREGHEDALRIYVDDESDPAINFTLTSTYSANTDFPTGDYTISVEMVGNPDEVIVEVDDTLYKKSENEVDIFTGSYTTSYFEFNLALKRSFAFSIEVSAAAGRDAWGYIDNIVLHNGHIKPEEEEPPVSESLLVDGGFESAGALPNLNDSPVWDVNYIKTAETLMVQTDSWTTNSSRYSFKFSYWPANNSGAPDAEVTVSQTFTVTSAGDYELTYLMATDGLKDSLMYLLQDEVIVHNFAVRKTATSAGTFDPIAPETVTLEAGEYTFVLHLKENTQRWAHFDDFSLLKVE